jgi:hypothetical protein
MHLVRTARPAAAAAGWSTARQCAPGPALWYTAGQHRRRAARAAMEASSSYPLLANASTAERPPSASLRVTGTDPLSLR